MITKHALDLLQVAPLDKDSLEAEINRIEAGYRLCNQLRESIGESNIKLQEELKTLKGLVLQLEADKKQMIETKASTAQIIQQMLTQANEQAQQRMQEIEQLRAEIKVLKKE